MQRHGFYALDAYPKSALEMKKPLNLTENDKRAFDLVASHGGTLQTYCSCVGEMLYPKPKNARTDKVDNRKRQGLALAGSNAMKRLELHGLITISHVSESLENVYKIIGNVKKMPK